MGKRWITGCMLGLILGTFVSAGAAADDLTVGTATALTGSFYTDLWSNSAADLDVRQMVHGYNLIQWDSENGLFIVDPSVVNGLLVTENDQGDRTFRISLYDDLSYSDGTPIGARDYLFTVLLELSPAIRELGGNTAKLEYLLGAESYANGDTNVLAGAHMLSELEFTLTVSHEYLPYFYELGLLDFFPSPISVIAPGLTLRDDGNGAYIDGSLDKSMLEQTLFDPQTGYVTHPSLVSGPYLLDSYDAEAETAEFSINPYFKGDMNGNLPTIEHVTFTCSDHNDAIGQLEDGTLDLLNKSADQKTVSEGMKLVSGSTDFAMSNYPRSGLSFIRFEAQHHPALSHQAVRQAAAWCMDQKTLVREYEGSLGLPVYGWYGIGQWMYSLVSEKLEYPPEDPGEDATDAEKELYQNRMAAYELDLDGVATYDSGDRDTDVSSAVSLLEADGWVLNRQGTDFTPGSDDVRCAIIDGELTALEFTLHYPKGNRMGELLEESLVQPMAEAGMLLHLEAVPMQELLAEYYGSTPEGADLLYLATNFDVVFDVAGEFALHSDGTRTWGAGGIQDEPLYESALALRRCAPGQVLDYCRTWVSFQERFSQVMPAIPVYSNVYFDFYTADLRQYEPGAYTTWTQAIIGAHLNR